MLSVQQAESIILDLVQPLQDREIVNLETATGRILATSVSSKLDFPYWDNSAMDGYAVRFADVENCDRDRPAILEIVEEIPAGYKPQQTIKPRQAARIFTGAMIPEGADTIVIQEDTEKEGNKVKILSSPQPQEYVRKKGTFYQAGNPMLEEGIVITPADIAILATAQCTKLTVYRRPRVAIFSTGDELITPDMPLQPGQIVDSNQYALAAIVAENGGIPIKLGIVPDKRELLTETVSQAISQADIVLSTGGVSVGEYDYVEQILAELGGEIHIRSVAVKPGKPLTVASFANSCLYFGIPGNPVSALVSCWRFVQPALKKLSGVLGGWKPLFFKARSLQELRSNGKRETYVWGKLYLVDGCYEFEIAGGSHSSGNLINLAQTNGLALLPVGETGVSAGDEVLVMRVNY
ncbi:MAG: molybdopterin molybdotransferase MoeA [Prochloraceae cyanobacterium]|nr:molybdopterin molybdotransferase MoeA [Prochloraceae cyanobacterium]